MLVYISKLLNILDRKCQFPLLDTGTDMFETPALLNYYLHDCNVLMNLGPGSMPRHARIRTIFSGGAGVQLQTRVSPASDQGGSDEYSFICKFFMHFHYLDNH